MDPIEILNDLQDKLENQGLHIEADMLQKVAERIAEQRQEQIEQNEAKWLLKLSDFRIPVYKCSKCRKVQTLRTPHCPECGRNMKEEQA